MVAPKADILRIFALSTLCALLPLFSGCGAAGSSAQPAQPTLQSFQITVTAPPAGGTVTSSPKGIACPSTCTATFPQNTQLKLTATPASTYSFAGWSGACSGMGACTVTVNSTEKVTATFSTSKSSGGGAAPGSRANVIAYIFTPDGLTLNTPEFALLSNGKLQATKKTVQPFLMTATAHGLVMDLLGPNGSRWPTGNLQSYAVHSDGSLKLQGSPVSFPVNQYAASLASDSTYVYAVSDLGLFAFQDSSTGLTPLSPIQETVPHACTAAEQNASQCTYGGFLTLGNSNAFFTESAAFQSGAPLYQLSTFARSQGQLTDEQPLLQTLPSVQALAGNFVYAIDFEASATFINLCTLSGGIFSCTRNVLANGQSLSDGFAQLLTTPNGSFLLAVVSDGSASPRVRVFRINPSSGVLTEVPGSPFLTGQYYFRSAALDPSGRFLLAVDTSCDGSGPCNNGGELVAMSINSTTGALAVTSNIADGEDPYTICAAQISQ
jgi:hypothetical protein